MNVDKCFNEKIGNDKIKKTLNFTIGNNQCNYN